MNGEGPQAENSVGDVISKIGKAVSDGAAGEGPPELLLTEDMRVWDSVPVAIASGASGIDEARVQEIVADSVLKEIESNPEIGALIRRAAKPEPEAVQAVVRNAVGPIVDAALSERMEELKEAVSDEVKRRVNEAKAAYSAAEDGRKKQARKAVRAELKALLSSMDDN